MLFLPRLEKICHLSCIDISLGCMVQASFIVITIIAPLAIRLGISSCFSEAGGHVQVFVLQTDKDNDFQGERISLRAWTASDEKRLYRVKALDCIREEGDLGWISVR